jgi:pimeloyl-ACP methyl ester carboxylesterase
MEELTLELPSGRVQAVSHGAPGAPLVICLHGLSANARAWDTLGDRLAHTGRHAVALDLRGRGLSATTPPGSYGLQSHAADVLAVAAALNAEFFDIAGWSMGALIGVLSASTAAGRLRRLVLIDHAGRMDDGTTTEVRNGLNRLDAVVADPQQHVDTLRNSGVIERWLPQWDALFRRELKSAEDGRWIARTVKSACEEDLDDMVAREWTEAWRPLTMPTLLVRSLRQMGGGYIVPESERDGLVAHAARPTVVEVDETHWDIMTADATWSAIDDHLTD